MKNSMESKLVIDESLFSSSISNFLQNPNLRNSLKRIGSLTLISAGSFDFIDDEELTKYNHVDGLYPVGYRALRYLFI